MNQIKKQKDDIRKKYKELRRSLAPDKKEELDNAISNAAISMASFRYAKTLLLYAATDDEINITKIATAALEKGKQIAFPKCDKDTHTMKYHYVKDISELAPDAYGICEPPETNPVYVQDGSAGSTLCFVPGLVYDKAGFRLGYGKGFYDRFLSSFDGCSIGVVYSDCILQSVPRGRFDVSVNILLTEKGVKLTSES